MAAIGEAVVQVLLAEGLARLTTTRVAERAGVSVGTLYQYFPNKQALLFTILLRHFDELATAIEAACDSPARPLEELAVAVADAYVTVKLARPDATAALYLVAGAIDQVRLPPEIFQRLDSALVRGMQAAPDARFADPGRSAFTLISALAGLSRGAFSKLSAAPGALDGLRDEARLLARAYLRAAADQTPPA